MIKQWNHEDRRPEWSQVAKYGPELKAYWSSWESLILMDGILYEKKHIICPPKKTRIGLPMALQKKCFTLLHNTAMSAHLDSKKKKPGESKAKILLV